MEESCLVLDMVENEIHRGVVKSVGRDCVSVRLSDGTDCSGCSIAMFCSGSSRSEVRISAGSTAGMVPGMPVVLTLASSTRWIAILLCLVMPVAAMALGIFVAGYVFGYSSDGVMAIGGVAGALLYILLLWFMRSATDRVVRWHVEIEKEENTY